MDRYVAVAVQNQVKCATKHLEVVGNIKHCMNLIDKNAMFYERMLGFPVKLVVFPEYGFSDWRGVAPPWWDGETDALEICIEIPGPETELIARKARQHGIYIAAQAFEKDPNFPGYYFNCGFIIDPNGNLIYKRHKNEHAGFIMYATPHDVLDQYMERYSKGRSVGETLHPVVDTEIGRLGMCMCYEMINPELHRQLAFNGAEVIIRPTVEMDQFQSSPTDVSQVLDRARAIENVVYYVTAQGGPSELNAATHDWSGTSRIINYDGAILAQARTSGETLVGAVIDIDRLRKVRAAGQTYLAKSVPVNGKRRLPLFRPESYDYWQTPSYPPNTWLQRPQTREEKRAFIRQLGEPGE